MEGSTGKVHPFQMMILIPKQPSCNGETILAGLKDESWYFLVYVSHGISRCCFEDDVCYFGQNWGNNHPSWLAKIFCHSWMVKIIHQPEFSLAFFRIISNYPVSGLIQWRNKIQRDGRTAHNYCRAFDVTHGGSILCHSVSKKTAKTSTKDQMSSIEIHLCLSSSNKGESLLQVGYKVQAYVFFQ